MTVNGQVLFVGTVGEFRKWLKDMREWSVA
jgi:hypothetical protein